MGGQQDKDGKRDIFADYQRMRERHVSGEEDNPLIARTTELIRTAQEVLALAEERADLLISMVTSGTFGLEDFWNLDPIDGITVLQIIARADKTAAVMARGIVAEKASEQGRSGANALHKEGNINRDTVRERWATGEYANRNDCADANFHSLGMSYETTRKALRGTPDPDPWAKKPAKRDKTRKEV